MKYKVGDYVTRPTNTVHLRVCAAYEGEVPLYAVLSPKDPKPNWLSELELDLLEFGPSQPKFKEWENCKAGDIVNDGLGFCKILARIGNVIMLSRSPVPKDQQPKLEALADQLSSLEENDSDKERGEDKTVSKLAMKIQPKTLQDAHRMVGPGSCEWHTVEYYALMNWELLRE